MREKTGWKHTEEAKQKISIKAKGRKFSEEHRAKLSKMRKGRKLSEEAKPAISGTASPGCRRHHETRHLQLVSLSNREFRVKSGAKWRSFLLEGTVLPS